MKEKIIKILKEHKNKKIDLIEIENKLPAATSYKEIATIINELCEDGYLRGVKKAGCNYKAINLFNAYHIEKKKLREAIDREIIQTGLAIDNRISLDFYLTNNEKYWKEDKGYIILIDRYLTENGLPEQVASIPERSYYISSDEKWLSEKNGLNILKRLKLTESMKITSNSEPAMFALSEHFSQHSSYKHLIVENKSVYYSLLPFLKELDFATLIYGAGWQIISGIRDFEKQFPFSDKENEFLYFGDLDHEGIKIWDALSKEHGIGLAKPFYLELLNCEPSNGKENQLPNKEALNNFIEIFGAAPDVKEKVSKLLDSKKYIPQEALKSEILRKTWRSMNGAK